MEITLGGKVRGAAAPVREDSSSSSSMSISFLAISHIVAKREREDKPPELED